MITNKTCFYPEGGGPLGDRGKIAQIDTKEEGNLKETRKKTKLNYLAEIKDCQKDSNIILHEVKVLKKQLKKSQKIHLIVDKVYRRLIKTSHSATHLLNHALREVLGPSTRQAGSMVEPGRLRFDFTSSAPMTFSTNRKRWRTLSIVSLKRIQK